MHDARVQVVSRAEAEVALGTLHVEDAGAIDREAERIEARKREESLQETPISITAFGMALRTASAKWRSVRPSPLAIL